MWAQKPGPDPLQQFTPAEDWPLKCSQVYLGCKFLYLHIHEDESGLAYLALICSVMSHTAAAKHKNYSRANTAKESICKHSGEQNQ